MNKIGEKDIKRFFKYVSKTHDCWLWTGWKNRAGYGCFDTGGRKNKCRWMAHRFSYTLQFGEIPNGREIDHLCRNRDCVNPAHLEVVTHTENILRGGNSIKTHCIHGHKFTNENTYIDKKGERHCRACRKIADYKRYYPKTEWGIKRRARLQLIEVVK